MAADRSPASWAALLSRLAIVLVLVAGTDLLLGSGLLALQRRTYEGDVSGGFANGVRAARPELLILGSSRAQAAFDDRKLGRVLGKRCFNGAVGGRGLFHAHGLLALVNEDAPPAVVVLDASWFDDERERASILAPFAGESDSLDELLTGGSRRAELKLASRLYRMQGRIPTTLRHLGGEPPGSGFRPKSKRMSERPLKRDARRRIVELDASYEAQLRALVVDARAHGSRLVFTEAPSWGQPLPQAVLEVWERVAEAEGVPFLRMQVETHPELQDSRLFADPAHLNAEGAAIATRLLAAALSD
jgi:hypothetical protein